MPLWAVDVVDYISDPLAAIVNRLFDNTPQSAVVKLCGLVEKPFCLPAGEFAGGRLAPVVFIFY